MIARGGPEPVPVGRVAAAGYPVRVGEYGTDRLLVNVDRQGYVELFLTICPGHSTRMFEDSYICRCTADGRAAGIRCMIFYINLDLYQIFVS